MPDSTTDTPYARLRRAQIAQGAELLHKTEAYTAPVTFGNTEAAIAAAESGVALCDRSHWGRIFVSDEDRLRFLHNQSTQTFMTRTPGEGCETVFVTSTARTLDLVTAYIQEDGVLLLTHPSCRKTLMQWMDRFIFFADKVTLTDHTDDTVTFSLIGPSSTQLLRTLKACPSDDTLHHHAVFTIGDAKVRVAVGSGLASPGYTLITDARHGETLWSALCKIGAIPMGDNQWEFLRIRQGRPVPAAELTKDYNPLEAGLWHTISFDKGCYIGQETIARLDTYNGVKQQLWGIQLSQTHDPGTSLWVDGKKVGTLTSIVPTDEGYWGLGYVRTKAGGEGLTVHLGEANSTTTGTTVDVPFLTRSRQDE